MEADTTSGDNLDLDGHEYGQVDVTKFLKINYTDNDTIDRVNNIEDVIDSNNSNNTADNIEGVIANNNNNRPYKCLVCAKIYKNKAHLLRHAQNKHLAPGTVSCDRCGKVLRKQSLYNHTRSCRGSLTNGEQTLPRYACCVRYCRDYFEHEWQLSVHQELYHKDDTTTRCRFPRCNVHTSSRAHLKRHIDKVHLNITKARKWKTQAAVPEGGRERLSASDETSQTPMVTFD